MSVWTDAPARFRFDFARDFGGGRRLLCTPRRRNRVRPDGGDEALTVDRRRARSSRGRRSRRSGAFKIAKDNSRAVAARCETRTGVRGAAPSACSAHACAPSRTRRSAPPRTSRGDHRVDRRARRERAGAPKRRRARVPPRTPPARPAASSVAGDDAMDPARFVKTRTRNRTKHHSRIRSSRSPPRVRRRRAVFGTRTPATIPAPRPDGVGVEGRDAFCPNRRRARRRR